MARKPPALHEPPPPMKLFGAESLTAADKAALARENGAMLAAMARSERAPCRAVAPPERGKARRSTPAA